MQLGVGTNIGAYMMKHWGYSAAEAIAWMRISRPGSVIGVPAASFTVLSYSAVWCFESGCRLVSGQRGTTERVLEEPTKTRRRVALELFKVRIVYLKRYQ